jgi:hypothetical protein
MEVDKILKLGVLEIVQNERTTFENLERVYACSIKL